MRDFQDDDDPERLVKRRGTPTGRTYLHTRCSGQTRVSGGDFIHICDPFWLCTSTYCCECAGFAPLSEVRWTDTKEKISAYRKRLRAETPGLVQAWRYGVGFLAGGLVGALGGLLVGLIAQAPPDKMATFAAIGGLVGGLVCYVLGTILLNLVFGIDYRRMR